MIFRGNNRNRRRGFHNTYVFYRLLQQALAGEKVFVGRAAEVSQRTPSSGKRKTVDRRVADAD